MQVYILGNKGYIDSSNEILFDREHLRAELYEEVRDVVREEMRDEFQDAMREIKEKEDAIQKKQEEMELIMRQRQQQMETIGSKSNKRWS